MRSSFLLSPLLFCVLDEPLHFYAHLHQRISLAGANLELSMKNIIHAIRKREVPDVVAPEPTPSAESQETVDGSQAEAIMQAQVLEARTIPQLRTELTALGRAAMAMSILIQLRDYLQVRYRAQ